MNTRQSERMSIRVLEAPTKVKGKTYRRWMLVYYRPDGRRVRESYNAKVKAEDAFRARVKEQAAEQERQAILMRHMGEKARHLSAEDLLDCVQAIELLQGRARLSDMAREYVACEPISPAATLRETCAKYDANSVKKWVEFRVAPDAFLMVAAETLDRANPSILRALGRRIIDKLLAVNSSR